jgi:hypothetical protein
MISISIFWISFLGLSIFIFLKMGKLNIDKVIVSEQTLKESDILLRKYFQLVVKMSTKLYKYIFVKIILLFNSLLKKISLFKKQILRFIIKLGQMIEHTPTLDKRIATSDFLKDLSSSRLKKR